VVAPEDSPNPRRFTKVARPARSRHRPTTVELGLVGPIAPADIRGLCERAGTLLESGGAVRLICDVGAVGHPDAVTVDALARLQLTAHRLGRQVGLRNASRELQELLDFMGLSGVIPPSQRSRIEPGRQAEEREERRRVQEERDPADPIP
jgi:ABC-type transporter Mla MlaB component